MAETIILQAPILVDYDCDECGEGKMRPTESYFTSTQTDFWHACTKCEHQVFLKKRYPYRDFIRDPSGWVE